MTQQQIQQQVNDIERIYADFRTRLAALRREQDAIAVAFLKDLETTKLQDIRRIIASQ